MKVRRKVVAQQRKEARNRKRLVAIPQNCEIDRVFVVVVGQEGYGSVDGNHEQHANNVSLLPWFQIMGAMSPDEVP